MSPYPGEGDPGRGPRGDGDPAEYRRRRRHRAHGAGRPAEDPQPAVPGTPRALRGGQSEGGQTHGKVGGQEFTPGTLTRTLAGLLVSSLLIRITVFVKGLDNIQNYIQIKNNKCQMKSLQQITLVSVCLSSSSSVQRLGLSFSPPFCFFIFH